jgi:hypothetical protein
MGSEWRNCLMTSPDRLAHEYESNTEEYKKFMRLREINLMGSGWLHYDSPTVLVVAGCAEDKTQQYQLT